MTKEQVIERFTSFSPKELLTNKNQTKFCDVSQCKDWEEMLKKMETEEWEFLGLARSFYISKEENTHFILVVKDKIIDNKTMWRYVSDEWVLKIKESLGV